MIAFLDGGTTQTRLRIWDGQHVRFDAARPVGARQGAMDGHTRALRTAVRELIEEARGQFALDAVVACGMLTSPSGLAEVPHLLAPVSAQQLASGTVRLDIEGCGEIFFIPGVRTGNTDVMRGEETEVTGLRQRLTLTGPVNFLHFGSHDKLIVTNDEGIQGSQTNINGELLSVLTGQTILRATTVPPDALEKVDWDCWQQGLESARQHGLSQAAFLVRVNGLLGGLTPEQGTSWLLGALAEANLRWIEAAEPSANTVLYGRATATEPFAAYLSARGFRVQLASETDSALAAVSGAAQLHDLWLSTEGSTWKARTVVPVTS